MKNLSLDLSTTFQFIVFRAKIYRLKLEYNNKDYKAEFYISNPTLKVKNRMWFQEVKDIATTIVAAILEQTSKVVIVIELDFLKDEGNNF